MFKEFCEDKGIQRQLVIPPTLEQNYVTEHRNRTLLDMARSLKAHANLLISLWGDALPMTTYFFNFVPSKNTSATPYDLRFSKTSSLDHLFP